MGLIETKRNDDSSIRRKLSLFVMSILLVVTAVLGIVLAKEVRAATATFQASDYRSSGNIVNSAMSVYWRGYVFSVTEDTTITKLVGGGGTGFQTAIYNVASVTNGGNTVTPGAPIGYGTNVAGTVNEVLNISGGNAGGGNSIFLQAGTYYLLASGKTASGSGNHWTVGDINVGNILLSPRISTWGPNVLSPVGKTLYWSSPASQNQPYTYLQGVANNAVTGSTIPALGFQYTIPDTDPAEVSTLAPTFSGSTVRMNGQVDDTGGGSTTMAIVYGQSSNLSTGNTTEILGTTNGDGENAVPFYVEKNNLAAGTWYYRARAENDSGAVLGSIYRFTVHNLNYGVANKTCHVTNEGGSISGSTAQKSYSYDADGDGGEAPIYSLGSAVTAVPDTGFAFVKWCDDDSTTATRTDNGENIGVDAYAQFAPQLTFNSHGGSSVSPVVAFAGDETTLPSAPTRSGYSFTGWNTEANGTGDQYEAGSVIEMPSTGFTLHALWVDSTDKNNDNVPDVLQPNVSSFINPVSQNNVTIALDDVECTFNEASASAETANDVVDKDYDYLTGMVNFSADCSNATVTVSIYYYGIAKDDLVVRKYNPNTQAYGTVDAAVLDQTTIDGQTVTIATYEVTDGGELDTDGEVNGTIVDPVGLASVVAASGGSSGRQGTTSSNDLASTGQSAMPYALAASILFTAGLGVLIIRSSQRS